MKKIFSLFAAILFAGSMMATQFQLVSSTDDLEAGANYVIGNAASGSAVFMATTENGNNRKSTASISIADGVITATDEVLVLELGGETGAWTFVTTNYAGTDGYLTSAASGNNNHCKVLAEAEACSYFTVSFDGDAAVITSTGRAERNILRCNPNNGTPLFACYTSGQQPVYLFKEVEGEVPPVEPTMDYYVIGSTTNWEVNEVYKLALNEEAEGEEYYGTFFFSEGAEFKVIYSDGETAENENYFPQGVDNNFVVTAEGIYNVYFRPAGDMEGTEGWHYGYIYIEEYVEPEVPVYTCAQVQANEATETGELNEVQVLFVNGGQFYVRDATGMTLIYKSNHGLAVGNFVSGIVGTSTIYNNVTPQFQPSNEVADWTVTEGSEPAYDVKAVAPVTADVNGVYIFRNVVFAEAVEFTTASKGSAVTATIGEENITIFNNYKKAFSFEANKAYDVLAVVTIYQNNPQVYFISASEHTATAINNAAAEIKAIKRIENGQLVIIKNGVRYDATGAILK